MNQEEKIQPDYDEVDFTEYVRIIIKRKWLIFGFLIIGLVGAATLTFSLAGKGEYKVETIIESKETIKNSNTLLEKINTGIYGTYPGMKAEIIGDTNLVRVEVITEDPEQAKKFLETINELIIVEQNNRIEAIIVKEKKILEENIEKIEKDINYLIYAGQQITPLQLKLYDLQNKLVNLQTLKTAEIVKEPTILGKTSGGPSLTFSAIIGGILGLFVGVIVVFGKEWWEKNKAKI